MGHSVLIKRRLSQRDLLRGMSQKTSKHRKKGKKEQFWEPRPWPRCLTCIVSPSPWNNLLGSAPWSPFYKWEKWSSGRSYTHPMLHKQPRFHLGPRGTNSICVLLASHQGSNTMKVSRRSRELDRALAWEEYCKAKGLLGIQTLKALGPCRGQRTLFSWMEEFGC